MQKCIPVLHTIHELFPFITDVGTSAPKQRNRVVGLHIEGRAVYVLWSGETQEEWNTQLGRYTARGFVFELLSLYV